MSKAMMAFPELRHPYDEKPIHPPGAATVLCMGRTATLPETGSGDALLIRPEDLGLAIGFELKPEGACFEDVCIPVPNALYVEQDGRTWFDLTAFADHIGQPYVADLAERVWSFAEVPAKRDNMMLNAKAPDIEITDRQGRVVRMADLKGKKALIVTWSSW